MSPRARNRLLLALQIAASLALLGLLAARTDLAAVGATLAAVRPAAVVGALALVAAQSVLGALRWAFVGARLGARVRPLGALGAYYVGLLIGQGLPPSLGADAYRTYWLYREGTRLGLAVRGVLVDRVIGLAALVVLLALTFPFLATYLRREAQLSLLLLVVVAMGGTAAALGLDLLPARLRAVGPLPRVVAVSVAARSVLADGVRGAAIGVLALVSHGVSAGVLFALARGIDVSLTFWQCLLVIPTVTLLAMLPISFGGWGVREGILVMALSLFAVPAAEALALSLTVGAVVLVNGLMGTLPLLLARERFRPVEAEASTPGPAPEA